MRLLVVVKEEMEKMRSIIEWIFGWISALSERNNKPSDREK